MERSIERLEWCVRTLTNLNHTLNNGYLTSIIETLEGVINDLRAVSKTKD